MQNVNFMRLNYQKLFALFLLLIFILPSEPAQKCPFRGIRNLRIQSKLASKHFAKVKNLPDKLCQLLPWCSCHFLPLSFLPIRMLWQFETSSSFLLERLLLYSLHILLMLKVTVGSLRSYFAPAQLIDVNNSS